jgi:L-threonylcarbamoyladenylate synthase
MTAMFRPTYEGVGESDIGFAYDDIGSVVTITIADGVDAGSGRGAKMRLGARKAGISRAGLPPPPPRGPGPARSSFFRRAAWPFAPCLARSWPTGTSAGDCPPVRAHPGNAPPLWRGAPKPPECAFMTNGQNNPVRAPTPEAIAEAGALLRAGELVAIPTETVYGLASDATDDRAVARIFAAKDRPSFNPLIVHVAEIAAARAIVRFDARAEDLAARFWPGPLTLVLPRAEGCAVSLLAGAGLDSLALRMPDHETARAVIAAAGQPLAAPSANPSGKVSPTTATHVAEALAGRVAMVLDGGPCRIGLESTVLDLTGPPAVLLRPGGLPKEEIEAVLGPLDDPDTQSVAPRGPGQLASHYATALPLRLNAAEAFADEALIAFGPDVPGGAAETRNLSPKGDLEEAAANLFATMRALDRPEFHAIAVMAIPETGLGRAIYDRLRRAAAPREEARAKTHRLPGRQPWAKSGS